MEEQDEEWRFQKSPSQESKLRLILSKGWWLGKKIAITGLALSSAPFVLPPLVVFSTLGVAFAVPFGFVFASYACTQKIMSKFFPLPVSPPLLEYKAYYEEDEGMDWDEEEDEFLEDEKQGLESRTEMFGDEKATQDVAEIVAEYEIGGQQEGLGWGKEKPIKEGEDKSVGNFQEGEKEMLEGEEIMEEESRDEANEGYLVGTATEGKGDEGMMNNAFEPDDNLNDETKGTIMEERGGEGNVDNLEKRETPLRKTSMIIEENRDGENVNNASQVEEKLVEDIKVASIGERIDGREVDVEQEVKLITETKGVIIGRNGDIVDISISIEEVEKSLQQSQNLDKIGNEGKPTRVAMGESGGKTAEMRDENRTKKRENKLVAESKGERAEKRGEENVYNSKEQRVQPLEDTEKMAKERRVEEDAHNIAVIVDKPIEEMKGTIRTRRDEGIMEHEKKAMEDMTSKQEKGTELVDAEIPIVSSKHAYKIVSSDPAEVDAANKGASQKETTIPSNEVLGEEKVWEQIDAMRTIVGYKATPHATCLEELKALYLFTGVEPPASFKESSDLVDVNYKLRFLMSIVGVK